MTLNAASEYIGPQQIFGVPNVNIGLPIINDVTESINTGLLIYEYNGLLII